MISHFLLPSATPHSLRPTLPLLPNLKPLHSNLSHKHRRSRNLTCRAEIAQDAPFLIAIGACVLNSLVFPVPSAPDDDDDDGDAVIDSNDARLAVMGIISFVPYFNWLSWIFALLDTGKQRYAVYALVYLAPYVRYNLSISPEESWLPIASILLCIAHIQLEASIKNGDLQAFQLFNKVERTPTNKDITLPEKERREHKNKLPSAQERGWGVPRSPQEDLEYSSEEDEMGK